MRPGPPGPAKRGVGRLALETGAPVVPIAVIGTTDVRRGWRIRPQQGPHPRRPPAQLPARRGALARARAGGHRPHLAVRRCCSGSGSAGSRRCAAPRSSAPARGAPRSPSRSRAPGLDVELGCRTREQAEALARDARQRALPARRARCPTRVRAVPRRRAGAGRPRPRLLRRARRATCRPRSPRTAARSRSAPACSSSRRDSSPPLGTLPVRLCRRARERARGRRARRPGARRRRARVRRVASSLGLARRRVRARARARCSRRPASTSQHERDVAGVELAGCAKNAAVLAAAAAAATPARTSPAPPPARSSPRSTGSRAASARRPRRSPGWPARATSSPPSSPTAAATAAPASCSASGVPAAEIGDALGQAVEAVDSVPLLAALLRDARAVAPADARPSPRSSRAASSRSAGPPPSRPARRAGAHERLRRGPSDAAPPMEALRMRCPICNPSPRRSSIAASPSCTGRTCATSTRTPTTASATTTTPRTSPSRRSCRPTATSSARCASPTAGRCARGSSASRTTSPPTTTATARGGRESAIEDTAVISAPHTTETLVEGREELERILAGVQQLPDDRREALIMRFALGMDNREIARAMGRSDGATKVLLHRAIKQLEGIVEQPRGSRPAPSGRSHAREHDRVRGAPARRRCSRSSRRRICRCASSARS